MLPAQEVLPLRRPDTPAERKTAAAALKGKKHRVAGAGGVTERCRRSEEVRDAGADRNATPDESLQNARRQGSRMKHFSPRA